MVRLIFDIQDAQKGNEAISDNHFLSEKMKPEFSNTWLGKSSVSCPLKPSDSAPLC